MAVANIVDAIRKNRISTTEVADALGKTGVLPNLVPVTPDLHRVGVVRAIFAAFGSNHAVHEAFRAIKSGEIPVVVTHDFEERAVLGELMAKFATLYRGAEAVVALGNVRDASRLRRERYPIWSTGFTPLGATNAPAGQFPPDEETTWRGLIDGGVAVCDDAGVVVIPKASANEAMLGRLQMIEAQEDIWFYCLDTLKWDTKAIVCDRAYLDPANRDRIPAELRDQISTFDTGSG